jgi:hypothetical protein
LVIVDTLQVTVAMDSLRELHLTVRSDDTGTLRYVGYVKEGDELCCQVRTMSFASYTRWAAQTAARYEYPQPSRPTQLLAAVPVAAEPDGRSRVIDLE